MAGTYIYVIGVGLKVVLDNIFIKFRAGAVISIAVLQIYSNKKEDVANATSSNFLSALCPNTASVYIVTVVVNPLACKHLTEVASVFFAEPVPLT